VTIDDICTLVGLQLGISDVHPADRLIEQLGAESIDLLNIVVTIEHDFGVVIAEERIPALTTVAALYDEVCRLRSEG
jgi:acyl carrier protein